MYTITKIRHVDRQRGVDMANSGKYREAQAHLREHTEVLGEFDNSPEARQCWRSLGMPAGANYHETCEAIYLMLDHNPCK